MEGFAPDTASELKQELHEGKVGDTQESREAEEASVTLERMLFNHQVLSQKYFCLFNLFVFNFQYYSFHPHKVVSVCVKCNILLSEVLSWHQHEHNV